MKIGILTQPLGTNYGGLLQNYALQTILKRMGHEVVTIQREYSLSFRLKQKIKNKIHGIQHPTDKEKLIMEQHTNRFLCNIQKTSCINLYNSSVLKTYGFDVYVVGSDQVWRPRYNPSLFQMFLDFTESSNVKRIAYAASFGTSDWEFSTKQTKRCASLIKQFDLVSVREESGVDLCQKHLGVNAHWVLDPTLLLTEDDYAILSDDAYLLSDEKKIVTYILDKSKEKEEIVNRVAEKLQVSFVNLMPKRKFNKSSKIHIEDCIFISIPEWISRYMGAGFIVTDSFHGTVFSILFKKPFIAIGNKRRGIGRFSSLLTLLGLNNRLVSSIDEVTTELINEVINYEKIDIILNDERNRALQLIQKTLI